jgi:hypothetical protein
MSDPSKTFGPPELCTWHYWPGICRFQTSSPQFARKLAQRSRARLVAWSVNKGYLRIFEEPIQPWRARRLVTRYLKAANGAFSKEMAQPPAPRTVAKAVDAVEPREHLKPTNEVFSHDVSRRNASKIPLRPVVADESNGAAGFLPNTLGNAGGQHE